MPFDSTISLAQDDSFEELYRLWDELADFGPPHIGKALKHCMQSLCTLTGADDAYWFGFVRHDPAVNPVRGRRSGAYFDLGVKPHSPGDDLNGWRSAAIERLKPVSNAEKLERYQAAQKLDDPTGDTTRAVISQVGRFRFYNLCGGKLVDLDAFQKTQHYDFFYRQTNIGDRLWVVFPVTSNTESCFVIDKYGEGRSFQEPEMWLASQFLRGLKWFHRQALISHGLGVSPVTLTPTEHRVLCGLLAGHSEKEIATEHEITAGSAHQYCVNIYNKYGVSGRTKLMALWLGSSEK